MTILFCGLLFNLSIVSIGAGLGLLIANLTK